jgi:hypothetical protein
VHCINPTIKISPPSLQIPELSKIPPPTSIEYLTSNSFPSLFLLHRLHPPHLLPT